MADRFEDLRNYVAVVSNGGVNAAAEAMGIAKSAVSRRLSDLEARLGVTLIDRTTRRFELTAIGEHYHQRASEILASLEALDQSVVDDAPAPERIKIGASIGLAQQLLAPALAEFASDHEGVAIELVEIEDALVTDADLLVATSPDRGKGRETKLLGEFHTVLCASPAYLQSRGEPENPAAVAEHAGITSPEQSSWNVGARATHKFNTTMIMPDATSAKAAAVRGAGLVQLPEFVVRDAIEAGLLRVVLPTRVAPVIPISASFDPNCPLVVRQLVEHLIATLALDR